MSMIPEIYTPGSIIIQKQTTADCMFFIVKGTVEVLASDDSSTVTSEMTSGQFFGEIGVLLSIQRTATIRAKAAVGSSKGNTARDAQNGNTRTDRKIHDRENDVMLFRLSKENVDKICSDYEGMRQELESVAQSRARLFFEVKKKGLGDLDTVALEVNEQNLRMV